MALLVTSLTAKINAVDGSSALNQVKVSTYAPQLMLN
jgi:hypothetical protein